MLGNAALTKLGEREHGIFATIGIAPTFHSPLREIKRWFGISPHSKWASLVSAIAVSYAQPAFAQANSAGSADLPGLSIFQAIQHWTQPVADILTTAIWLVVMGWNYLIDHPAAAGLLGALLAFYMANRSINSAREMMRLRETFDTIDESIRDNDVIKSRMEFRKIKEDLKASGLSIAKFRDPTESEDIEKAVTLRTILNNYENYALGVRYNILDEEYLYRWTRTGTLADWNYLLPLVSAYRSAGQNTAYIEFEGLATSWIDGKSYRSGKKIKSPNRHTKVH